MKFIFKLFTYLFVFILALLVFFPKQSVYNLIEQELAKNKVIISGEKRDEKLFALDIKDSDIYYEGINVANVNKTSFESYLVYTKLEIKDIRLLDSFKSMVPSPISNIKVEYSILDIKNAKIKANGLFGKLNGNIDILNRVITLELEASSKMKSSYSKILRQMRLKEGKYLYEYRY